MACLQNLLPFLSAPGADDDGSGTITLLEVLHNLVNASYSPTSYDIEFHFYSAEEGGMLGSNAIASDYNTRYHAGQDEGVRGMLQMDMTAYIKPGTEERIGIIEDFVDPDLTNWIKGLIKEYCDIPTVVTKCGYACSDHTAWTKIGVPSAFAIGESKTIVEPLLIFLNALNSRIPQKPHLKTRILGISTHQETLSMYLVSRLII